MRPTIAVIALLACHVQLSVVSAQAADVSIDSVPSPLERFSGMMIGRLIDREIELGSFTVEVDYVARVWGENQAENPRVAVGRTFRVTNVSGRWIDRLLAIELGDTIEFEARHLEGDDSLQFSGEWLERVKPYDPADHPVPPEGLRGFRGVVRGKVLKKKSQSREVILQIVSIESRSERDRSKKPEEGVGKRIVLTGFWANMSKPFDQFKVGDMIRSGVRHRIPKSDHFSATDFAEKVNAADSSEAPARSTTHRFSEGTQNVPGVAEGERLGHNV